MIPGQSFRASEDVMPWERPLPTFEEIDDDLGRSWRVCSSCGASWSYRVGGHEFACLWRRHIADHVHDRLL